MPHGATQVTTDRVLRGSVALLGVGAIVVAVAVVLAITQYLGLSQTDAHTMAHSAVGIVVALLIAGVLGVGGVALLGVAYVD